MANYIYKDGELYHAHKYIKRDMVDGKWRYYYDYNNGDGWSDKVGVTVGKTKSGISISGFNTKADKYWRKNQKAKTVKRGPLTVNQAEDGTEVTLNIPTKKIKSTAEKHISKGKKKIDKLFKKLSKK